MQSRRRVVRSDDARHAELAARDRRVAGDTTAVGHDRRRPSESGKPIGIRHRRDEHLAGDELRAFSGDVEDADSARTRCPGLAPRPFARASCPPAGLGVGGRRAAPRASVVIGRVCTTCTTPSESKHHSRSCGQPKWSSASSTRSRDGEHLIVGEDAGTAFLGAQGHRLVAAGARDDLLGFDADVYAPDLER